MTFVINVEFPYVNMGAQVEFVGRNAAQRYAGVWGGGRGGRNSCRELYYTTTLASERVLIMELIFCGALKDCQFAAVLWITRCGRLRGIRTLRIDPILLSRLTALSAYFGLFDKNNQRRRLPEDEFRSCCWSLLCSILIVLFRNYLYMDNAVITAMEKVEILQ